MKKLIGWATIHRRKTLGRVGTIYKSKKTAITKKNMWPDSIKGVAPVYVDLKELITDTPHLRKRRQRLIRVLNKDLKEDEQILEGMKDDTK